MKKIRKKKEKDEQAEHEIVTDGPYQIERSDDATQVSIDIRDLPPPGRSYFANSATIRREGGDVVFVFAQKIPLTDKASTLLAISYSADHFQEMLERIREFATNVGNFVEETGYKAGQSVDFEGLDRHLPDKVHTERASFERMSFRATDAEIEFYALSPSGFREAMDLEKFDRLVVPQVAVTLSTALLNELLRTAFELSE